MLFVKRLRSFLHQFRETAGTVPACKFLRDRPIVRVDTRLNHFRHRLCLKLLHSARVARQDAQQTHPLHERPIIAPGRCAQQVKHRNLASQDVGNQRIERPLPSSVCSLDCPIATTLERTPSPYAAFSILGSL